MTIGAGYRLNEGERGQLVALRQMPGFQILLNIMESEVAKFSNAWINISAEKDAEILASHKLAKAASQFYQGLVNTINGEMEAYHQRIDQNMIQPDITEGLFSE